MIYYVSSHAYCCPVRRVVNNYNGLFILCYSTWRGDSTNMFVSLDHSCFLLDLYVYLFILFAFCNGYQQKDWDNICSVTQSLWNGYLVERPYLSTCHNKYFVSETLTKVYTLCVHPKTRGNNLIIFNISSVQS